MEKSEKFQLIYYSTHNDPMSKVPVVAVVACMIPEMGIGYQGKLPWRLATEMKYFREVTSTTKDPAKINAVVMGRKTWESIPSRFRPLPNRVNMVVSRQPRSQLRLDDQVYSTGSLSRGIDQLRSSLGDRLERIYIIGGAEIYAQSYALADHWLVTKIQALPNSQVPEMDTHLDPLMLAEKFQERPQDELAQFVPPITVPLADPIDEKGFQFWFTLYTKI